MTGQGLTNVSVNALPSTLTYLFVTASTIPMSPKSLKGR